MVYIRRRKIVSSRRKTVPSRRKTVSSRRKTVSSSRRRLQSKSFATALGRVAVAAGAARVAQEATGYAHRAFRSGGRRAPAVANSSTLVVTESAKDNDGTGPYQQWSQRYAQATFGKMTLSKLLSKEQLTLYHQRFTRFNQGKGAEWLSQTTDATNLVRTLPLVYWDLTSCVNHVSGSISNPGGAYQLAKSTNSSTNGNIVWRPVTGLLIDGSASTDKWQVEKSEHGVSNANSYPGASSVLEWAAIELELWGQQQYHTKWTLELCQFNEDVAPDPQLPAANTGGPYEMFWDSMIKGYAYSPLYSGSINGWKGKKRTVLRRYNVDLDPTSTTETNADPHCKTFKLFFRFNRRCNYDWSKSGGNGQTIEEFNDIDGPTEVGTHQVTVHPNARIYFVMRATDFNPKDGFVNQSVANTPSYSWKIRTRHQLVN